MYYNINKFISDNKEFSFVLLSVVLAIIYN